MRPRTITTANNKQQQQIMTTITATCTITNDTVMIIIMIIMSTFRSLISGDPWGLKSLNIVCRLRYLKLYPHITTSPNECAIKSMCRSILIMITARLGTRKFEITSECTNRSTYKPIPLKDIFNCLPDPSFCLPGLVSCSLRVGKYNCGRRTVSSKFRSTDRRKTMRLCCSVGQS